MLNSHTGPVATIVNDLATDSSKHFKQGSNTTSLVHRAGSLEGDLKIGGKRLAERFLQQSMQQREFELK